MSSAIAAAAVAQYKVNEKKWTAALHEGGLDRLPNVIFERQQALGLDAIDINIILHIASYWWTPEDKPFHSKKAIATAMGVDPRTIQRRIVMMETAKLMRCQERRSSGNGSQTNIYHLDCLIEAAKPYALEGPGARYQGGSKSRHGRKGKPRLAVVKGGG